MKYWDTYVNRVNRYCSDSTGRVKDLAYWRNNLFAGIVINLLPFCLIALLPGIFLSLITGQFILAFVDIVTFTGMVIVAFAPGISLRVRKIIFLCCMYTLSCALLYYLGLYGPGLVYLLATCIFSILIFPTSYKFWTAWLNLGICFLFAIAIFLNAFQWTLQSSHSIGEWVAVTSNLVFLSFLSATLIPRLFNGLQETIDKEKQLKEELKQALLMLQEKNIELEQFAYVASHDLKEPLRMVTSFIGLLKNKYGKQLDEKANNYMDFAIDGSKKMVKLISGLLELSRTANHDSPMELVDLDEILREVNHNIVNLLEESGAEIIVKTPLPTLNVYRPDINRLFQNLLSNAIKFRKKEIKLLILLDAKEMEDEWQFSIEDNGIGIAQDKFENIFEIFSRLQTKETYEGTGIGLAVCKKMVGHHGGRIWVESEPGKGSIFYFTIKK